MQNKQVSLRFRVSRLLVLGGIALACLSIVHQPTDPTQLFARNRSVTGHASPLALQQRAALSPTVVIFDQQRIGTTSFGRGLSFFSSVELHVDSVIVTEGSAEFRKVTDNCTGRTLSDQQTCNFSISFRPTATGPHTGAVTVFEGGNTYAAQLVGSVAPDYTIDLDPPSITVKRGQSVHIAVTVIPIGDFGALVTLSCSGLPAPGSCTFSPISVTPRSEPVTVGLTIRTFAPTTAASAWLLFPGLLLILGRGSHSRRRRRATAITALLVFAAFASDGCSDSGTSPQTGPGPTPGTPIGTVTVDVVGTAGTNQRAAPLFLTVE